MTIRFAVKDFCDATVAIEDGAGKILRHLASGVLGDNAPESFSWNTKKQEIVWDKHGKLKIKDAVPGLGEMSDFKIDNDDNLYMISNIVLTDYAKAHPDKFINSLVKMGAGKGRILTDGKVPVPLEGAAKIGATTASPASSSVITPRRRSRWPRRGDGVRPNFLARDLSCFSPWL